MTLTIEIPDTVVDRATAAGLAPAEVSRFAVVGAVAAVVEAADKAGADTMETESDPVAVEGIRRELSAVEQGDVTSFESYATSVAYAPIPWDEFATLMVEGIDPDAPLLSDYATSRAGMYEDHY